MSFKNDGYLIVKNIMDTSKLYDISIKHADNIPGTFDEQSPNSPAYYGSPSSHYELHESFIDRIEKLTGLNLFKTYFYWRMYYDGAILSSHIDRPACEISGTLFLGGDEWDIFLKNRKGNIVRVEQKPGDLLLYRGCELKHWRSKFHGEQHAQIFLHYVDQNGPNSWCKDDILKSIQ